MIQAALEMIDFDASMRCDRCGARALSLAQHPETKSELLFCRHHRQKHGDKLLDDGWEIIDDAEGYHELAANEQVATYIKE